MVDGLGGGFVFRNIVWERIIRWISAREFGYVGNKVFLGMNRRGWGGCIGGRYTPFKGVFV